MELVYDFPQPRQNYLNEACSIAAHYLGNQRRGAIRNDRPSCFSSLTTPQPCQPGRAPDRRNSVILQGHGRVVELDQAFGNHDLPRINWSPPCTLSGNSYKHTGTCRQPCLRWPDPGTTERYRYCPGSNSEITKVKGVDISHFQCSLIECDLPRGDALRACPWLPYSAPLALGQ